MASLSPEEIETGRLLFAGPCDFIAGATSVAALPPARGPEVALAGRCNVGKSSLINALTGRGTLARVSRTPGRTQQLNFFLLGGKLILVDLPGYGFARAPKRQVAQWTGLTIDYLRGRPNLRRVLVLVDSRHGLKDSDREMFDQLDEAAVSYQVVLTKADELPPKAAPAQAQKVAAELAKRVAAHPEVVLTSARTGAGIPELRAAIAALVE